MSIYQDVKDAIRESILLSERVERLTLLISEVTKEQKEDNKTTNSELRELREKVLRIETLIEFGTKYGNQAQPAQEHVTPQIDQQK